GQKVAVDLAAGNEEQTRRVVEDVRLVDGPDVDAVGRRAVEFFFIGPRGQGRQQNRRDERGEKSVPVEHDNLLGRASPARPSSPGYSPNRTLSRQSATSVHAGLLVTRWPRARLGHGSDTFPPRSTSKTSPPP